MDKLKISQLMKKAQAQKKITKILMKILINLKIWTLYYLTLDFICSLNLNCLNYVISFFAFQITKGVLGRLDAYNVWWEA